MHATVEGKDIPHGIIFSLFMCCKMVGSQLFVLGLGEGRYYSEKCLCFVFAASVLCFLVPMFTDSYFGALLAFCMYECGLGLYWPAIAMLRADLVPDDIRSTVASLFRVPLNVLVVGCLLCIGRTSERVILLVCCAKLGLCFWCALRLYLAEKKRKGEDLQGGCPLPLLDTALASPQSNGYPTTPTSPHQPGHL